MAVFLKILFFLISVVIASCSSRPDAQERPVQMEALEVNVFKVSEKKNISFDLLYPGRTKSISRVNVVARVGGILKEKFFKEGQFVNKDDLLFKIEPDIYQAEYDSLKAQVEQAVAELNRAERDWLRIKASYEDGVASEQQRDAALSAYEQAKAMLEASKARLKQAEINLKYTDVRAPISGIAGARLVDAGNMVNPGTVLVTITGIEPIYVEFSIPDTDLHKLSRAAVQQSSKIKSLKAKLLVDDRPYIHTGHIDFIDSVIDEKTSSVNARAVFPNPQGELMPGQFVRIKLSGLQTKKAITVPQKAVLQTPLGTSVYVVQDGKAVIKNIKLGDKAGEDFIVEEGLKPGDMVIIDNLMKLRPEMQVKIGEVVN